MKKGRISKQEEKFILENINKDYNIVANELSRDPKSLLEFIKKKVAKGDFPEPSWLSGNIEEEKAKYNLQSRPYYSELKAQFTSEELKLFEYHWTKIISQFGEDVIATEEIQVVDLIKLELLMNRSLKSNKTNVEQITVFEALLAEERAFDVDQQDGEKIFNLERQIVSLRAAQESLNRDYRDLQDKKNKMLKDMKGTREQRIKRFEDRKTSFAGWMTYLAANPEVTQQFGYDLAKMTMAMESEKERLSQWHKYQDGEVDQPFLTPETVKDDEE
jgi:hypothetical protein